MGERGAAELAQALLEPRLAAFGAAEGERAGIACVSEPAAVGEEGAQITAANPNQIAPLGAKW